MEDYKFIIMVLAELKDGMTFTLMKENCADGDNFLIFSNYRKEQTITIHKDRVPFWVEFDGDEPMRLEECPIGFFHTLHNNIKEGNYSIIKK